MTDQPAITVDGHAIPLLGFGTFAIPGGGVCFVLYVPLYVRVRHWGVLGTGIVPQALGVS